MRSLRLELPSFAPGTPGPDPPQTFHQTTELLLRLAHAQGLEELTVERKRVPIYRLLPAPVKRRLARRLGQHFLLALGGVRCVPSLRRVELVRLDGVPAVLVTVMIGKDAVVHLSVYSVTVDAEALDKVTSLSQVPRPLIVHFQRANADWESILLLHTRVNAFECADPPLHTLRHLRLASISTLRGFLQAVQKLMYGTERKQLLPNLKTVHYTGRETLHDESIGYRDANLFQVGLVLAQHCPQIQELIVNLGPIYG